MRESKNVLETEIEGEHIEHRMRRNLIEFNVPEVRGRCASKIGI